MTRFRNSALHSAAGQGDVSALQRLLTGPVTPDDALHSKALNIEAIGKGGWTPLEVAVYKGHARAVTLLLAAGARVRPQAVALAREYGRSEILARLQAAGERLEGPAGGPKND